MTLQQSAARPDAVPADGTRGSAAALRPPPERPGDDRSGGAAFVALPLLGSLGSVALVSSIGGEHRERGLVAAALMLLATVGFVLVQVDRQRQQRRRAAARAREAYRRHLGLVRDAARAAAAEQRAVLVDEHPGPDALPALAARRGGRWRADRGGGPLPVRFGLSHRRLSPALAPPEPPEGPVDPVAAVGLRRLLAAHGTQPDLPATADLRACQRIEVCGEAEEARALARALVCSAAAAHPPDHLAVAVLGDRSALPTWGWVKWLPHAASARERDAVGPARLVDSDPDRLLALLPAGLAGRPPFGDAGPPATPHLLLVVDGADPGPEHPLSPPGGRAGVTVLDLPEAWDDAGPASAQPGRLRLQLVGDAGADGGVPLAAAFPGTEPVAGVADQCGSATAEATARRLAAAATGGGPLGPGARALLGLVDADPAPPAARWRPRPERDRLRSPIGVGPDGAPVHLDLKESAHRGIGPHGLVVGATGSGKSELLRTLVLGLALDHHPDELAMVLVDFKGGATFAGLAALPHVSAAITNLEAELPLVDRMQDALAGELVRRQELLRRSGHASAREHARAREAGADLEPLPSLFVVVDEFSEMLAARPELLDLFVAIGRLGRSLGVHLLLASQRLDEGRLRGLEAHLSYRIGLRTFSAAESRAVLGVPDAAGLPATPGLGFLRAGPDELVPFRAGYVSGPDTGCGPVPGGGAAGDAPAVLPFTVAEVRGAPQAPGKSGRGPAPPSLLDRAVSRLAAAAPPTRRIWLPPLGAPETVGGLMPDLAVDPAAGLVSDAWRARGPYVLPLGVVDRPREQRRETLTVDLREAGGHLAVVGGPRSGKSTLLRTAVTGLALTTTPLETRVLVLDLGGGTCAGLGALPHVAGVATRADPEALRRALAEATALLEDRERSFRAQGIDSMATYRERRARGGLEDDDGWGDLFVVVDGWAALCAECEDAEVSLRRLATDGLGYGVHLLVAAGRWSDLRAGVRDAFGSRVELRLGDPADSEVDRRAAALVPADRPGRGLVAGPLHVLGALPHARADPAGTTGPPVGTEHAESTGHAEGAAGELARACAASWRGPRGPRLRLLPASVDLGDVRRAAAGGPDGAHVLLGVDERRLAPVALDVTREPHLVVLGDGGSGKTAALRAYADEVRRTHAADEAQLVLVDYRRSLLDEVPGDYLLDHLTSAAGAGPALAELAARLEERLPGPGVTPRQLRDRSWWRGPDVFVLVDDHDLVATGRESPLLALEHLLPQARDVGLHLVLARRTGGASRALHEPVLRALRELAAPGLQLAGDPAEGPLLGPLRPQPAPPGRARLLTRDHGVRTVQLAWREERA